jgi:hypothetical protein
MHAPVDKVPVYHIDCMVFKCAVQLSHFENFAENPNGVNEVGKRREDYFFNLEGRLVVVLQAVWEGYLLCDLSTFLLCIVTSPAGQQEEVVVRC